MRALELVLVATLALGSGWTDPVETVWSSCSFPGMLTRALELRVHARDQLELEVRHLFHIFVQILCRFSSSCVQVWHGGHMVCEVWSWALAGLGLSILLACKAGL